MIRSETEYQRSLVVIKEQRQRLAAHVESWGQQGFTPEQVARLREPLYTFHLQLVEEVQAYERSRQQ